MQSQKVFVKGSVANYRTILPLRLLSVFKLKLVFSCLSMRLVRSFARYVTVESKSFPSMYLASACTITLTGHWDLDWVNGMHNKQTKLCKMVYIQIWQMQCFKCAPIEYNGIYQTFTMYSRVFACIYLIELLWFSAIMNTVMDLPLQCHIQ